MVQRLFGCLTVITLAAVAMAQQSAGWHDDLVEQMVGNWKLDGIVMGRPAHHSVTAQWTLGNQFLQIHEQTSSDAPATESRYDATWFLGFDDVSERYVLHLMDVFGGRYSETLGYGTRDANELRFVFEYPDGPFHTTWQWLPDTKSWEWHLEQKDRGRQWKAFADFRLTQIRSAK
jgi:hypothetical protein